jgi:hypothetical protein
MLRLLLLLDGEATDMDEFELDLLGLSWAHVTIFLIGVDGCPHHHRHANELQRISDVNHHVSFVDAQGNTPERFVTHELLKWHLGYDISMSEFQRMEELPPYSVCPLGPKSSIYEILHTRLTQLTLHNKRSTSSVLSGFIYYIL